VSNDDSRNVRFNSELTKDPWRRMVTASFAGQYLLDLLESICRRIVQSLKSIRVSLESQPASIDVDIDVGLLHLIESFPCAYGMSGKRKAQVSSIGGANERRTERPHGQSDFPTMTMGLL